MLTRRLLPFALLLWAPMPAAAADGAPGEWTGRQLTTPPPPPPAPPPPAPSPAPAAGAAGAPWGAAADTPDDPVPAPAPDPAAPEALDYEAIQLEAELEIDALLQGPVQVKVPKDEPQGRGIDRVAVEPEATLPSPAEQRAAARAQRDQDRQVGDQEIDPYNQISYTAYTLDFGEVELGLQRAAVGIAPRVQLSTSLPLDAVGALNLGLKADVIRAGPVDFGLQGGGYLLSDSSGFRARWITLGAQASVVVVPRWSLHFGGSWNYLAADGIPEFSTVRPFLWGQAAQDEAEQWISDARINNADLRVRQVLASLRFATDVRLTWRDSLVVQASAIPFGAASQQAEATVAGQQVDVPPILQLEELLVDTRNGSAGQAIADSYVVSLAYQASWEHLQVRFGIGSPVANPFWLLQAYELSWRFGGVNRKRGAAGEAAPTQAANQP